MAVEHIFSGGHDTISIRRASLHPDTIRTLMLVKHRLRLAQVAIDRALWYKPDVLLSSRTKFSDFLYSIHHINLFTAVQTPVPCRWGSKVEVYGYSLWWSRHHTSAVIVRPYTVYGTAYSPNAMGALKGQFQCLNGLWVQINSKSKHTVQLSCTTLLLM